MAENAMTQEHLNADNGSQSLTGVSFALLALTTFFFFLFLLSRYFHEKAFSPLMFWLILFAYIFNIGNAIDNALSAVFGDAGKHVDTLDHATNIASGKIGKAADYLYIPSAILPKLAMLAFYFQVFTGHVYRSLIYFNAGLVCTLVAGLLQSTFICKPFSAYWTGEGKCGDLMTTYRWLSYPNLLADAVMLVMPFPVLLKLQVSNATKVKLIVTFLTGSLGIVAAILRIVSFYRTPIFSDPTWYLIEPSIYSVVEPSAYLICAIMPTLRHLTRRIARFAGFSTSTGYSSYGASGPSRGVSARVRSKLNISLSKGHAGNLKSVEKDAEMQRLGERNNGWSRVEAGAGTGRGDGAGVEGLGGIVCKTDVTMYVERKSMSAWGKQADGREESSLDSRSLTGGRMDGFEDEVPLRDDKSSNGRAVR